MTNQEAAANEQAIAAWEKRAKTYVDPQSMQWVVPSVVIDEAVALMRRSRPESALRRMVKELLAYYDKGSVWGAESMPRIMGDLESALTATPEQPDERDAETRIRALTKERDDLRAHLAARDASYTATMARNDRLLSEAQDERNSLRDQIAARGPAVPADVRKDASITERWLHDCRDPKTSPDAVGAAGWRVAKWILSLPAAEGRAEPQSVEKALREARDRVHKRMQEDADVQGQVHPTTVWSQALAILDDAIAAAMGYRFTLSAEKPLSDEGRAAVADVAACVKRAAECLAEQEPDGEIANLVGSLVSERHYLSAWGEAAHALLVALARKAGAR